MTSPLEALRSFVLTTTKGFAVSLILVAAFILPIGLGELQFFEWVIERPSRRRPVENR
jgi:hypothetical protein